MDCTGWTKFGIHMPPSDDCLESATYYMLALDVTVSEACWPIDYATLPAKIPRIESVSCAIAHIYSASRRPLLSGPDWLERSCLFHESQTRTESARNSRPPVQLATATATQYHDHGHVLLRHASVTPFPVAVTWQRQLGRPSTSLSLTAAHCPTASDTCPMLLAERTQICLIISC